MQTRLLATFAGAALGFVFAPEINAGLNLGLPAALAFAGFAAAGLAIGYVASILIDVFAHSGDRVGSKYLRP